MKQKYYKITFVHFPKFTKKKNSGRPIVNSIGSITEKISAYIDETLKPLSKQVSSYVKYTMHFLNTIKDIEINKTDTLCTIDISSLYTNIAYQEGKEDIHKCMKDS